MKTKKKKRKENKKKMLERLQKDKEKMLESTRHYVNNTESRKGKSPKYYLHGLFYSQMSFHLHSFNSDLW